jgi:hypothetical protein
MLVDMKGGILGYGAILAVLLTGTFVIIFITKTGPLSATVATKEGEIISFGNSIVMLTRILDTSIEFISQRTAYDLGKNGGVIGSKIADWNETYPTINDLKTELEKSIKNNLPKEYIKNDITITWGESKIDVSNYDVNPCGPIENSKCFLVKGNKSFTAYSESISSRSTVNHKINSLVNSSYFKLLYVGRQILENNIYYNLLLTNRKQLEQKIYNDFGLSSSIISVGNFIEVSLWEECLKNNEFHCIAPTKPGETKIIDPLTGKQIPYDYINLTFKVSELVVPECNDKIDNDFDGKCDFNGCCSEPIFDNKLSCTEYGALWLTPDPDCTDKNDDRECGEIGTSCNMNKNCCGGLICIANKCTVISYKLTVYTSLDIWPEIPPVSNVQVTVIDSGLPPASTNDSGIVEFDLPVGDYQILVEDPKDTRPFSHFWDHNCSEAHYYDEWYEDTNQNPYPFTIYDGKDREITAFYKTFTNITDSAGAPNTFEYNGIIISGKLLKENSDPISNESWRHDGCTGPLDAIQKFWDRNITLEYSTDGGATWTKINNPVKVAAAPSDGSWSLGWSCVAGTNKLRASFIPNSDSKDWYYVGTTVERDIICVGVCGDTFINPPEDCDPPNNVNSSQCPQTISICDYTNRRRGTRDSLGDCDATCNCIQDDWIWGIVDGVDYCANCPSHCGDGTRNCVNENCEGSDLGGQTCEGLGYAGGVLACTASCTFDTSGCLESICNNGKVEYPEECDPPAPNSGQCGGRQCKDDCTCDRGCGLFEDLPVNAVASSELRPPPQPSSALDAIDEDEGTSWVSESKGPPQWIYFDLNSVKCISGITAKIPAWQPGTSVTIDIKVSNDALTWTTVVSDWRIPSDDWFNKSFAETNARYILINETSFVGAHAVCTEFRAHSNNPNCLGFHSELKCPGAYCKWCPECGGSLGRHINQWQNDKCIDIVTSCGYNCLRWWCNAECSDVLDCCDASGPCRATAYAKCENCACSCRNTPFFGYTKCSV